MADVYRIGVTLALANGVSPILAIIGRDLLGLNTSIKKVEGNFKAWGVAVGGVAAVLGGSAILGAMAKLTKSGAELVHQQELMKVAGMANKEIAEATSKAYEVSAKVQTTTISENLKHLRELRYAFGNIDTAQQYIEQVTKANAILNSVKGGGTDQVWELVKSLEQKGETANPQEFSQYVDIMTKAVIASGGKVTPAQFFSAFKYGRTAMLGWDETFIGQYLPRLIQSMSSGGGSGSGTGGPGNALMSAFAKVVQGQMPKKAAEEFAAMGLVQGSIRKAGGGTSTIEGGIAGRDLFQHNPYEWVQSVLMPALAKHNITSQEQVIEEISKLFPVRTASQIIAEMGLQGRFREGTQSPFEKDARLQGVAMATDEAYKELSGHDPTTIMNAFTAQWHAMIEAIGSPLVSPAIEIMKMVTSVFTGISQFASTHPEAIKYIGEAIAAFASALVVLGGVALASLVGIPAAVIALATALATLAACNFDKITAGINAIAHGIDAISGGFIGKGLDWYKGQVEKPEGEKPLDKFLQWFHHSSYQGGSPDQGSSLLHRASWEGGIGGGKSIQVHTALNIDGRKFAEMTSHHLARRFEFPERAQFSDNLSSWQGPDAQAIST
jgi:hypothetical protein